MPRWLCILCALGHKWQNSNIKKNQQRERETISRTKNYTKKNNTGDGRRRARIRKQHKNLCHPMFWPFLLFFLCCTFLFTLYALCGHVCTPKPPKKQYIRIRYTWLSDAHSIKIMEKYFEMTFFEYIFSSKTFLFPQFTWNCVFFIVFVGQ